AGVLPVGEAGRSGDGLVDAQRRVEVDAALGEGAEPDGRPDLARALRRLQGAGDDVEQRRLAGAVGPDGAEALPRVERQLHAAEQPRPVAVAVADAVEVDRVVAQARRAEPEVELALARRPLGAPLDDGRRRGDAGLRLARARRRAATQPGQLGAG